MWHSKQPGVYLAVLSGSPSRQTSQIDSTGWELFTADAFPHAGRRFIVLSDEKLSALLELERVTGVSLGEKKCLS